MRYVTVILLVFSFSLCLAQGSLNTKSKKAIEYYREADNFRVRGMYDEAEDLLLQAIKKDKKFVQAYFRLGCVYRDQKRYSEAKKQFELAQKIAGENGQTFREVYFELGAIYLKEGSYEEAGKSLKEFLRLNPKNKRVIERTKLMLGNVEFALENQHLAEEFNPRPLSDAVNKFAIQYFPVLTADQKQLIFTKRDGTSPDHDEDLVISTRSEGGKWKTPVSISDSINTRFNEGTCTVSADGRKLIFTSCFGRKGYGSCDLFVSYKVGDHWSIPTNLGRGVNSGSWESQPTLSADGRTLYFVSNRRGGVGRRDIWMSKLNDKGQWSEAQNLGATVNTPHDDISPFIHANGRTLYFSSNGLSGFGGFDIFYAEKTAGGWQKPANLGFPVNTGEDQMALFISADGKKGYYSNENLLEGNSIKGKIFEFDVPEELQIAYKTSYVYGRVFDNNDQTALRARIELIDLSTNEQKAVVYSDSVSGEYLMILTQGAEYALYVNKRGYLFKSLTFNYTREEELKPILIDLGLDPLQSGATTTLKNIFFEFNQFTLSDKSKTELEKIATFLRENLDLKVLIAGHTDNVGDDSYNRGLSLKRARSVYDYLLSVGLDAAKLSYKGYGSTKPLVPNDTPENRQKNRRIDFIIL